MRRTVCKACGGEVPLNGSVLMFKEPMCVKCAKAGMESMKEKGVEVPEGAVERVEDPTICSKCGKDNGQTELRKVTGRPLCAECVKAVTVEFPTWIKLALAGMVVLTVVSLAWNWRFLMAYVEMKQAHHAMGTGNVEEAHRLASSAAKRVPESGDMGTLAAFYEALMCLKDDKCKEAVPLLKKVRASWGEEPWLLDLTLQAELGAAFDDKDYDLFLRKSEEVLGKDPGDATALGTVASAHACKYVETGDEKHKKSALEYLDKARAKSKPGDEKFADYEARIMYRLDKKEIISREEYERRQKEGERGAEK